ncbi:hypothetical protein C8J57DRAFT_1324253 [Mycena rebaudengoi]|nr:hypothetical protein C8J57DRAFT_1324253 [Mycena rebaudengoi]
MARMGRREYIQCHYSPWIPRTKSGVNSAPRRCRSRTASRRCAYPPVAYFLGTTLALRATLSPHGQHGIDNTQTSRSPTAEGAVDMIPEPSSSPFPSSPILCDAVLTFSHLSTSLSFYFLSPLGERLGCGRGCRAAQGGGYPRIFEAGAV